MGYWKFTYMGHQSRLNSVRFRLTTRQGLFCAGDGCRRTRAREPMSKRSQLRFVRRIESNNGPTNDHRQTALGGPALRWVSSHCTPRFGTTQAAPRRNAYRTRAWVRCCPVLLLDKLSTMESYLGDGSHRSIHTDDPADLLDPTNIGASGPADAPAGTQCREPGGRQSRR